MTTMLAGGTNGGAEPLISTLFLPPKAAAFKTLDLLSVIGFLVLQS